MKSSRLLSILILLQLRTRLTAEALAEQFEVSVRTIYRDIDALSAAGVPVYGDRGPGGGFQLLDGYRTRLTGLDADEAEAMLMIGLPGPAAQLGLGHAAARAKGKLLASLPDPAMAGAERIAGRFHLDPVDWYQAAEEAPFLPAMARAVLDQTRLHLNYESWTATRDWTVDPLGLVMKGGVWYAVVRTAAKFMTFRVSNIKNVQPTGISFDRLADFDLPQWWNEAQARFEQELRPGTATIRTSPDGAKRLARQGAYAQNAIAEASTAHAMGWLTLQLPIENEADAAHILLGLGVEVEVLEPEPLRARMADMAKSIARLYEGIRS
jgi:predicted DNA-binding transcriptional regulator YafY